MTSFRGRANSCLLCQFLINATGASMTIFFLDRTIPGNGNQINSTSQHQWGALKLRKPYKGNQFLSNYSETVGPIVMILSADPHENWMPMKCWKNQPSSTSVRARAHLSLRAQTYSSSGAPPIAKIPKGDLEAMPRATQKQRNWTPKSAVRARALHTLCAPCVHGPVAHQQLLQMQKFKRETWSQGQKWLRNPKIELLNLLCRC